MTINVSASLIKDFIDCPQKAFYRLNYPELSEASPEMKVGTLVHKIVEKQTNRDAALTLASSMLIEQDLLGNEKLVYGCINNYFDTFLEWTSVDDVVEQKFKLDYKSYNLVGKIDRIVSKNTVIDWKTSTKLPRDLSKDIQFIIYQEAFKRLYGSKPASMIYASLGANKAITVHINEKYTRFVFDKLIPKMLIILGEPDLIYKRGIVDYFNICLNCNFIRHCWEEEFKDVVDS
jgi:CRISPR/Cas system-associated exonuclease Cas4 (RecB family)